MFQVHIRWRVATEIQLKAYSMKNPRPEGKITTTFSLSGQAFDPDLFTRLVCIEPTKIWRQRLESLKSNPAFPQIEWRYVLAKRPHWSMDDAVREMLEAFASRREAIVSFANENKCSLHVRCQLFADSSVIIYELTKGTIETLAGFGCEFSFVIGPEAKKSKGLDPAAG